MSHDWSESGLNFKLTWITNYWKYNVGYVEVSKSGIAACVYCVYLELLFDFYWFSLQNKICFKRACVEYWHDIINRNIALRQLRKRIYYTIQLLIGIVDKWIVVEKKTRKRSSSPLEKGLFYEYELTLVIVKWCLRIKSASKKQK